MIATTAAWTALLLFAGGMIFAALKDLSTMTIPNALVLVLAGSYLVLAPLSGMSVQAIAFSVLAGALVLVCTFALFALGWIGGGDAKLAPVAVMWLGSGLAFEYLVYASLCGTGLTLLLLQFRSMPMPAFLHQLEWPARLHDRKSGVPYGVALAMAALLLVPKGPWITALM